MIAKGRVEISAVKEIPKSDSMEGQAQHALKSPLQVVHRQHESQVMRVDIPLLNEQVFHEQVAQDLLRPQVAFLSLSKFAQTTPIVDSLSMESIYL